MCLWVCICIETNAKSFCENQKVRETGKQALEAFNDVLKHREQVKNRVAQTRAKETEKEKASQRNNDPNARLISVVRCNYGTETSTFYWHILYIPIFKRNSNKLMKCFEKSASVM